MRAVAVEIFQFLVGFHVYLESKFFFLIPAHFHVEIWEDLLIHDFQFVVVYFRIFLDTPCGRGFYLFLDVLIIVHIFSQIALWYEHEGDDFNFV